MIKVETVDAVEKCCNHNITCMKQRDKEVRVLLIDTFNNIILKELKDRTCFFALTIASSRLQKICSSVHPYFMCF